MLFADSTEDAPPAFLITNPNARIRDVAELCKKIAGVIIDANADIIAIQEGPSDIRKLKLFVNTYLNDDYVVFGGLDGMRQRVYVMIKKNEKVHNPGIFTEVFSRALKQILTGTGTTLVISRMDV